MAIFHPIFHPMAIFHHQYPLLTGPATVQLFFYNTWCKTLCLCRMKDGQKDIFYMAADSLDAASSAPFVERLVQKGFEVSVQLPCLNPSGSCHQTLSFKGGQDLLVTPEGIRYLLAILGFAVGLLVCEGIASFQGSSAVHQSSHQNVCHSINTLLLITC